MLLPQFSLLNLALFLLLLHLWISSSDHYLHSYLELFSYFFFVLYLNMWGHHLLSLLSHKLKATQPLCPPFLSPPNDLSPWWLSHPSVPCISITLTAGHHHLFPKSWFGGLALSLLFSSINPFSVQPSAPGPHDGYAYEEISIVTL